MSPNNRLPSNSRTSDWVRLAICLALLSVAAILTFIVFRDLLREASDSGLERRKEVAVDDVQRVRIPGSGVVDYQRVFELVSEPGEGKEAFLLRIASLVQEWTKDNEAEACAFIATDGERWGLKLITLRSQFECVFAYGVAPEGMTTTRETFHSHPPANSGGYITLTEATKAAAKALGDASLKRVKMMRVENGGEFSERDFKAGPGYLITNGHLLFQDGRGKKHRREIGEIP